MADYYELLGVSPVATTDEIKRAYRRLARELHPDANPGDPAAEERFKQITLAYEVLSNSDTRARYDRFGEAGVGARSAPNDMFGAGLGDLFESLFGASPFGGRPGRPAGPPPGQDIEVVADLAFEDAVFGATVPVSVNTAVACDECGGTGAELGTKPVPCVECAGSGQVQRVRQSFLGQVVTASPCGRCGGSGEVIVTPCSSCRGEGRVTRERTFQVDVPAGVDDGSTLRLNGRGPVGRRGGPPGDLYVHLRVRPHERFVRRGEHLFCDVRVSMAQAALGTRLTLDTLDGEEELSVAPGTQSGKEIVLRGRGVPLVHGRGRGDLRVRFVVETPTDLSEDEEQLLRQLAELRNEVVEPHERSLFSRIKSAFQ